MCGEKSWRRVSFDFYETRLDLTLGWPQGIMEKFAI
jgi:hypothetical protein